MVYICMIDPKDERSCGLEIGGDEISEQEPSLHLLLKQRKFGSRAEECSSSQHAIAFNPQPSQQPTPRPSSSAPPSSPPTATLPSPSPP